MAHAASTTSAINEQLEAFNEVFGTSLIISTTSVNELSAEWTLRYRLTTNVVVSIALLQASEALGQPDAVVAMVNVETGTSRGTAAATMSATQIATLRTRLQDLASSIHTVGEVYALLEEARSAPATPASSSTLSSPPHGGSPMAARGRTSNGSTTPPPQPRAGTPTNPTDSDATKRVPVPCPFFKGGNCKFGAKCFNIHDGASEGSRPYDADDEIACMCIYVCVRVRACVRMWGERERMWRKTRSKQASLMLPALPTPP